jgi:hypothetical protein
MTDQIPEARRGALSPGVGQRAQMDIETLRGLLIANGGGAVALLAVLPSVLDRPGYEPLAYAILAGLLVLMFGVAFAIAYNIFRRRCSLEYEQHGMRPPHGVIFGLQLWAPTVCCIYQLALWLSLACFVGTGAYVAIVGMNTVSAVQATTPSKQVPGAPKAATKIK